MTKRLLRAARFLKVRWLDERGTQLVELSLVVPVMILLFGAVAEFGRFFYTYATLAKAARAASRYAITRPFDATNLGAAKSLARPFRISDGPSRVFPATSRRTRIKSPTRVLAIVRFMVPWSFLGKDTADNGRLRQGSCQAFPPAWAQFYRIRTGSPPASGDRTSSTP